ncbi:MAG: nitroreductase family protein [Actinomycetota bacterium]
MEECPPSTWALRPSGGNIQPWAFVVATDAAVKALVGDIYRRAYHRYEKALLTTLGDFRTPEDEASFHRGIEASRHLADNMSTAPAIVAVCMPDIDLTLRDEDGPLDIGTLHASVFPAIQNLMVAARVLGIGSTMTTAFRIYQDDVRGALEIPEGMQIVALLALGRPRGKFGVARRKPGRAVTHWNRFGNREAPI